jgi:hypothetical protein
MNTELKSHHFPFEVQNCPCWQSQLLLRAIGMKTTIERTVTMKRAKAMLPTSSSRFALQDILHRRHLGIPRQLPDSNRRPITKASLIWDSSLVNLANESFVLTSLRIPLRMRRPPATFEALGRSPLIETRRAHSTRVERIPSVAAATRPQVILTRRPSADRAPDARAGGVEAFLLSGLAIQSY